MFIQPGRVSGDSLRTGGHGLATGHHTDQSSPSQNKTEAVCGEILAVPRETFFNHACEETFTSITTKLFAIPRVGHGSLKRNPELRDRRTHHVPHKECSPSVLHHLRPLRSWCRVGGGDQRRNQNATAYLSGTAKLDNELINIQHTGKTEAVRVRASDGV